MLGAFSGDSVLGPASGHLLGDLASRVKLATEAPDRQAKAELHGEQMRRIHEENAPADPMLAQMFKDQTGIDLTPGTSQRSMKDLLTIGRKSKADEMGADEKAAATEEKRIRSQTMAAALADRQAAKTTADEAKAGAALDKRFTQFGQELDPTKARGGEMAKVVNALTQYGKVRQLLDQNPNPNSTQMYEIARTFDRAVSGGSPTAGGTGHLIPATALGSASDFAQWLTNSPVGRNQQAFVKQIRDSVDREDAYGQGLLKDWQGKKASRFSDLAAKDKSRFLSELSNWGLGEDSFDPQSWAYKGAAKASAAATVPSIATDEEYEALPAGTVYLDTADGKKKKKR